LSEQEKKIPDPEATGPGMSYFTLDADRQYPPTAKG